MQTSPATEKDAPEPAEAQPEAHEAPGAGVAPELPREETRAPARTTGGARSPVALSSAPKRPVFAVAARDRARLRPRTLAWLSWVASIVVLAVLIWAGYNFRSGVMRTWPPTERVYTLLGLPPAPPLGGSPTR